MNALLVYGLLRPGKKHFKTLQERFGTEAVKSHGLSVILPNLKMVNLGYYPAIVVSSKEEDKTYFEAIWVSNEVLEYLSVIESKSGFELISVDLEGDLGIFKFWIYTRSVEGYPVIKTGDWEDAE